MSARTFVILYWGAQALALLPRFWLTPQHSAPLQWMNSAWVALLMCAAFALQVLWIWQQVKLAAEPVAATSPKISRLLALCRMTGSVSLAGFLILVAINIAFGGYVTGLDNWLDPVFGVAFLGLVVSGVFAAQCLCKTEVELTSQAKPSVFGTCVQFFYAGLTAGAIARRARKAVATAEASQLGVGVAV